MTDFKTVVRVLAEGGVDFIVVGGLAGIMHGSARLTFDVVRTEPRSLAHRGLTAIRGRALSVSPR